MLLGKQKMSFSWRDPQADTSDSDAERPICICRTKRINHYWSSIKQDWGRKFVLAAKPAGLGWSPRNHTVNWENGLSQDASSFHMHPLCAHTGTWVNHTQREGDSVFIACGIFSNRVLLSCSGRHQELEK